MKASLPLAAYLLLATFLGCSRQTVVTLVDPYWLEILGREAGERLIDRAAGRHNYTTIILSPANNTPASTVIELVKAIDKPYAGMVLSPLYMGEVHSALQSAFPEMPMCVILGSPTNITERTSILDLDQTAAFKNAALTALRKLRGKSGAALGVFLRGTTSWENNRTIFERTWKEEADEGLELDIVELTWMISSSGALNEIKNKLSQREYLALFLLTGPLTPRLYPLLAETPLEIGLESPVPVWSRLDAPLFEIKIDWEGLYREAFQVLEDTPGRRHIFYQIQ